jgi:hypothetical protein
VQGFQAQAWSDGQLTTANKNSDWQNITLIELLLTLKKNQQQLVWPTSIALLRKTQLISHFAMNEALF